MLIRLLALALALAQPTFSGEWVLARAENATASAQTINVQQTERIIEIERHVAGSVEKQSYIIGMVGGIVGGRVGEQPISQDRFGVRWDGEVLVIERSNLSETRIETWAMEGGRLKIMLTLNGKPPATLWYRRKK